jgi:uncharacterized protein YxeA
MKKLILLAMSVIMLMIVSVSFAKTPKMSSSSLLQQVIKDQISGAVTSESAKEYVFSKKAYTKKDGWKSTATFVVSMPIDTTEYGDWFSKNEWDYRETNVSLYFNNKSDTSLYKIIAYCHYDIAGDPRNEAPRGNKNFYLEWEKDNIYNLFYSCNPCDLRHCFRTHSAADSLFEKMFPWVDLTVFTWGEKAPLCKGLPSSEFYYSQEFNQTQWWLFADDLKRVCDNFVHHKTQLK